MKVFDFKKILPYCIAIIAFIFIAYAYSPEILSGKIVNQSDISSWQGMSKEIVDYNNSHPGERALWTNSMFSGMPATSISVVYKGDLTFSIYKLLFTGERPASYLLISLIGGFLLFLAFGVNIYLAALGAIALTFCSYNMQIIQVGHNSKMAAIAFMPWVLASIVYAYRKRPWLGAILFGFALSFQIKANHPQITYYLAIIILGFAIWQFCASIKDKTLPKFIKTSLFLLVAGIIGIATNTNHLWPTYEYAEHTMRGGTELTDNNQPANKNTQEGKKTRNGLDLTYATSWSYGINETPNLLIPNFNGGSSAGALSKSSETYKVLSQNGYATDQIINQLPLYWGPQPFTAGPMYLGAICIFLFILGLFVVKGGVKWWISGVSLLALLLAWGYHCMPVSEFFFNWAPLYNKFRTVSMILVILQILVPILAVLALNEIIKNYHTDNLQEKKKIKNGILWSLCIAGGFCLIFTLFPSLAGSFTNSQSDSQLPQALAESIKADRISLLRADAIRSLLFILLSAVVLFAFTKNKLKSTPTIVVIAALILIDLWSVDKRYLNDSHFVTKKEFSNAFALRNVDKQILEDKDPDYRVLDLSINTFNDAYVSYHHKTIGGYSPVKLQRYQDIIDHNIFTEMNEIIGKVKSAKTLQEAQDSLPYCPIISMLNAKYFIIDANYPPLLNKYALGNAWFVSKVIPAQNADQEMALLKEIDPANTAVMSTEFFNSVADKSQQKDTSAIIDLESYSPNKMVYNYRSQVPQVALFSEVFYAPGWNVELIDKQQHSSKLPLLRANYILRALSLPAGNYSIVFTFAPESFSKGELVSKVTSGILILLLLGTFVFNILKKKKNE